MYSTSRNHYMMNWKLLAVGLVVVVDVVTDGVEDGDVEVEHRLRFVFSTEARRA